ncbi:MAG TPA: prepilin-type N-terminal cleavage/methylation domain-containing protein [Tepidisphaeraceae bacterium]|jgi:general secretion pathway protein G|nr:prepilin-type N-terminal cleavage/methylation domain-containing protein [Tepidisphaeraceae bacterium]
MRAYHTRKSGFTLVEILIVVIILGILAAIVIPQFTNASEDARKNSLTSQLQTIRSQLSLASVQHLDNASPHLAAGGTGNAPWDQLTVKTNADYTVTGTPAFGPYLNSAPINPLNGGTDVVVNTSATTDPAVNSAVAGGTASTGWVYYTLTNKIFATTKSGTKVYDEATGSNDQN